MPHTSKRFARGLAALAIAVLSLGLFEGIANATVVTSPNVCDGSGPKYYCTWVHYEQNGSYVTAIGTRLTGGLGCATGSMTGCGASQWQLQISSFWRKDPSTGTWYWLTDYGRSSWHTSNALYAETAAYDMTYYISAIADIQMKPRYQKVAGASGPTYWCYDVVDFYLPAGAETYIKSGGDPCAQD